MSESEVDLAKLFKNVTEVLQGEKASLNEADSYNHNHGDHMVENFNVITEALEQKRGAPPAEQLAYASKILEQSSNYGSAKIYSQGLTRAADQLQGQPAITADNALSLVRGLLGGAGDEAPSEPATRGISTGGTPLGNLFTAGSAYMQAKQEGDSPLEAILKAIMAGNQNQESPHQSQSGQIVGGTLINVLSTMLGGQKPKSKPKPAPKSRPKTKPASKQKTKPKSPVKTKPKSTAKSKTKSRPASKPKSVG